MGIMYIANSIQLGKEGAVGTKDTERAVVTGNFDSCRGNLVLNETFKSPLDEIKCYGLD